MLPKFLLHTYGFFRSVVAYFLPLQIVIIIKFSLGTLKILELNLLPLEYKKSSVMNQPTVPNLFYLIRQGSLQNNRFVSEPANRVSQSTLRILQWNVDGLSTKVHELRQRHQLEKVNICLTQETKLTPKGQTPDFPGFSAIRQDRPASHRGGGLLTLVKEGIVYQRIAEVYQPLMENQSIQIQLSRRRWATIHSLYAAPIRGQDTLVLAPTEPGNLFLTGGDPNAHSPLWDEHQPADQRGELEGRPAIEKGLPISYAQWLRDFLSNRKAKVQINGDRGRQLPLRQGLHQGSVLSPLLFLLYNDDLRRVIPENVDVAMFADDVSLFSSHPNKEVPEAAIQEAITIMAEWSRCHKLTLNTSKCDVAFFINNSKEARWQPSVQLDGTTLNATSLTKFLGVTIDRAHSFGPHVTAVVSKAAYRCRVLTSITSKGGAGGKFNSSRSMGHFISVLSTTLPQLDNPTGPKQSSPHHHRTAQNHPS